MIGRDVTTVICARNAANTIARAVRSAASQSTRILLVDDFSSDDTVAQARAAAIGTATAIEVASPPNHGTMGETRQFGLDCVATPFVVWLDADDEMLPGRVGRLLDALEAAGSDLATDGVEIVDGVTGQSRGAARIPAFLRRAPIRLFERMYLPGPGVIAARTTVARDIGYDTALHGCEDVDFLLRALARGVRMTMLEEIGYRLHAYPSSLSRDRDRQRLMYRAALEKHAYGQIRARYATCDVDRVITVWALVSIAMFREDYVAALCWIACAEIALDADVEARDPRWQDDIREPDGPYPYSEAWRVAFSRGTARLLLNHTTDALADLQRACDLVPNPEALNNLGVACARLGRPAHATSLFARALAQRPDYADAGANLAATMPFRITTHPLRVETARQDYRDRSMPAEC